MLVATPRSCTVMDQSLLSVRVRLMMEEKKLRPWGGPISIGAWFLWIISIWKEGHKRDLGGFMIKYVRKWYGVNVCRFPARFVKLKPFFHNRQFKPLRTERGVNQWLWSQLQGFLNNSSPSNYESLPTVSVFSP